MAVLFDLSFVPVSAVSKKVVCGCWMFIYLLHHTTTSSLVHSKCTVQMKCLATAFLLCVFCHYVMLTGDVFISHLRLKPFEWEQWVLLPWVQGQKRSMERGNETSVKPNPTRVMWIIRLPCLTPLPSPPHFIQERLVLLQDGANRNSVGFTIHKQVRALWSCWGKKKKLTETTQTSLPFVFLLEK